MSSRWLSFIIAFGATAVGGCVLDGARPRDQTDGSRWISAQSMVSAPRPNSWLAFRKEFEIAEIPENTHTTLAADTKYWLWLNGSLMVREGGLKWGPAPGRYYYDELDLSPFLVQGKNEIEILLWYFGKDGMSHRDHGVAGLRLNAPLIALQTDSTWQAAVHPAFRQESSPPQPNWRLPESNVTFDARDATPLDHSDAPLLGMPDAGFGRAVVVESDEMLVGESRPVPQWKDFGLTEYQNDLRYPFTATGDTIVSELPYNAQVTPWFEIEAVSGQVIDIRTDNYRGGSEYNVRTTYTTRDGRQQFETPGWMNGHFVRYHFPPDVTVHGLKYRETGYASDFAGRFQCDEPFYNELWDKARRTLYLTMRDNYMDCPDRERAQWWGDVVLEMQETFYALDRTSDLLSRKAILELMHWQRADSTIFSPVPAGNWDKELPTQMLASVGYYGIWMYYMHTGDIELIREVYPAVRRYLSVWKRDDEGLVIPREGGWTWGDWGANKDMPLIFNGWYHLALKGMQDMARVLGYGEAVDSIGTVLQRHADAFNATYWNGTAYRSTAHSGATDDRSHALAVLSGIAPSVYYQQIREILINERHSSPYFEKYVLEALFDMGYPDDALARMRDRFGEMVGYWTSTLWEGWEIGSGTWGGGTYNHAWSGGGLTLLSSKVGGVEPLSPGYDTVRIKPRPGMMRQFAVVVPSTKGKIVVKWEKDDNSTTLNVEIPGGVAEQEVWLPANENTSIYLNNKLITAVDLMNRSSEIREYRRSGDFLVVRLGSGTHEWRIQN